MLLDVILHLFLRFLSLVRLEVCLWAHITFDGRFYIQLFGVSVVRSQFNLVLQLELLGSLKSILLESIVMAHRSCEDLVFIPSRVLQYLLLVVKSVDSFCLGLRVDLLDVLLD